MTTIEFWNLLVSSTATIFAAIAILLYIILWYKDKSNNSYDVFDATYLDILKTGMENPSFRNPVLTNDYINSFSGNEKIKYVGNNPESLPEAVRMFGATEVQWSQLISKRYIYFKTTPQSFYPTLRSHLNIN